MNLRRVDAFEPDGDLLLAATHLNRVSVGDANHFRGEGVGDGRRGCERENGGKGEPNYQASNHREGVLFKSSVIQHFGWSPSPQFSFLPLVAANP